MAGGRPRIIESPDQLDELADAYFATCKARDEPVALTGLIIALGLSSRESFDEYGRRPEFSDSVKRAKMYVEWEYEKKIHNPACTGAIFALKNFGWRDKVEQEISNPDGESFRTQNTWTVQPVAPLDMINAKPSS